MTCWMRRPAGSSLSISAPALGKWKPGFFLTEGSVSMYSHKGSKVTRFITYKSQKCGWRARCAWGRGQSSIPRHEWAEEKAPISCKVLGAVATNFSRTQLLSVYFKRCPREKERGNLSWESRTRLLIWMSRLWVCTGLSYYEMPQQQLTIAVLISCQLLTKRAAPVCERGCFILSYPALIFILKKLLAGLIMRMVSHIIFIS